MPNISAALADEIRQVSQTFVSEIEKAAGIYVVTSRFYASKSQKIGPKGLFHAGLAIIHVA